MKAKSDKPSILMAVSLQVPRGLWAFLEKIDLFTDKSAKEHIEWVLRQEMQAMLGAMPGDIFDLKAIARKYGKGRDIPESLWKR